MRQVVRYVNMLFFFNWSVYSGNKTCQNDSKSVNESKKLVTTLNCTHQYHINVIYSKHPSHMNQFYDTFVMPFSSYRQWSGHYLKIHIFFYMQ